MRTPLAVALLVAASAAPGQGQPLQDVQQFVGRESAGGVGGHAHGRSGPIGRESEGTPAIAQPRKAQSLKANHVPDWAAGIKPGPALSLPTSSVFGPYPAHSAQVLVGASESAAWAITTSQRVSQGHGDGRSAGVAAQPSLPSPRTWRAKDAQDEPSTTVAIDAARALVAGVDHADARTSRRVSGDSGRGAPSDQAAAAPAPSPRVLTLYVGGAVTFGSEARAGSTPFAQLRTTTRLTPGNGPLLLTRSEFTAAPGADFDIADASTFRAVNFEAGVAWGPAAWNLRAYVGCGVLARAFEADGQDPPAQSRCVAGVLVQSTDTSHLALTYGHDQRAASGRAAQLEAAVEVGQGLALVGSVEAHGRSVTVTVAACKRWGGSAPR